MAAPAPIAQPEADPAPVVEIDQSVSRPGSAGRLVRHFDFEEAQTNPGRVPRHWFRQRSAGGDPARPGFPAWNEASLSYAHEGGLAFAGDGSVMLPTKGGSTALVLGEGVVPVFENADYVITAKVRTLDLAHARACLVARFLDREGRPIAQSDVRSPLTVTDGTWQDIHVEISGDSPLAAFIQVELCVLQPLEYGAPGHGVVEQHRVWPQDFSGAAWFDDVLIMQLPRVELSTGTACNIINAPERPTLSALVRDLTGERLRMRLEALSVSGEVIDSTEKPIGAGIATAAWTPKLTELGWYRATMTLTNSAGAQVGGSYVDFIWAPAERTGEGVGATARGSGDRPRFGLVIDDLPAAAAPLVPELVSRLGTGSVTLPLWDRHLTPQGALPRVEALVPIVGALLEDWQDVSVSIGRVPEALERARRVDADDPWSVLISSREEWNPYLTPMLEKLGQRVNRWQVGLAGDDRAFWRDSLSAEIDTIRREFSGLVPGPVIGIPSRADRDWKGVSSGATDRYWLISGVSPDTTPEGVGAAARAWVSQRGDRPDYAMVFQRLDPDRFGMQAGAEEAAKRAVEFWAACSRADGTLERGMSMAIQQPWAMTDGRRPRLLPRPELAVWRTLIDRLADRRVVGTFPIAEGVVCYVLAPAPGAPLGRGGALVAWNRGAEEDRAVLTADLGLDPVSVIDIFGNARSAERLEPAASGRRPLVRIPITHAPQFIEGIDVPLVRFLSMVRIEPEFLESTNQDHEHEVVIENPWPTGITGRLTILEPGGYESGQRNRAWQITPRSTPFAVPAGQNARLPIRISFSPVEEVGAKEFVMELQLAADKPYGAIEVRRFVEVGLNHIALELAYHISAGGDVVVEATVLNTGKDPLTLDMTCFAPGLPRAKSSIADLTAGNQSVKRFTFSAGAPGLRGQRILVSASEPETGARITRSIVIE